MAAKLIKDIQPGDELVLDIYGFIGSSNRFTGVVGGTFHGKWVPAEASAFFHHSNIYPELPETVRSGISDDSTSYQYISLIAEDNTIVYIGMPWIIESTLTSVEQRSAAIKLVNVEDTDSIRLRQILESAGYEIESIALS